MFVSVIIPTYNRKEILQDTLVSLFQQTYPLSRYEIVVADDGSTDGTADMVQALDTPCEIRYNWQENRGRAAARNLGAAQARGEFLLFLDADMQALPELLEAHVGSQRQYPDVLVQGKILLAPSLAQTPFGRVYPGNGILASEDTFLAPFHCATGNLSLRREAWRTMGGFDEGFGAYGWEDTEFGCRADRSGLRLLYNPRAISYHHDHAANIKATAERSRQAARSVETLFARCPELQGQLAMLQDHGFVDWHQDPPRIVLRKVMRSIMILSPARWALEEITSAVEARWPSPQLLRPLYRWVIGTYICLGYRQGLRARHG